MQPGAPAFEVAMFFRAEVSTGCSHWAQASGSCEFQAISPPGQRREGLFVAKSCDSTRHGFHNKPRWGSVCHETMSPCDTREFGA